MVEDTPPLNEGQRYWKFVWQNLDALPPIGKMDHQPKNRALRRYAEGVFYGENQRNFPSLKTKESLAPLRFCAFCGRRADDAEANLALTSEHVIPEFLGAGLELPQASCVDCQTVTSDFESTIARELFDPVRKSFGIEGKNGVLEKSNFPLDIGREISDRQYIPLAHFPTILVLPQLYPASSFSRRPMDASDPFNFLMYNINANKEVLKKYDLDNFSSQAIDMVRFSQLIAKIAHVYAKHYWRADAFVPTVADFVRTNYAPKTKASGHLQHVGGLWQYKDKPTQSLHEIEVGRIAWNSQVLFAVRVRLFACCGMRSYFVNVGNSPSSMPAL